MTSFVYEVFPVQEGNGLVCGNAFEINHLELKPKYYVLIYWVGGPDGKIFGLRSWHTDQVPNVFPYIAHFDQKVGIYMATMLFQFASCKEPYAILAVPLQSAFLNSFAIKARTGHIIKACICIVIQPFILLCLQSLGHKQFTATLQWHSFPIIHDVLFFSLRYQSSSVQLRCSVKSVQKKQSLLSMVLGSAILAGHALYVVKDTVPLWNVKQKYPLVLRFIALNVFVEWISLPVLDLKGVNLVECV